MAESFSWASAIDVGAGAIGGLLNWYGSRGNTPQSILAEGQRKAQNTINASANSLAATVRYLNNQRLMEAAGREFNALGMTLGRQRDASASQRFEQSLRNQEQAGASAANIAASGVGGAALDAISLAHSLQAGRLDFSQRQQEGFVTYNTAQRMAGVVGDAFLGLDRSMIGGNIDTVSRLQNDDGGGALGLLASLAGGVLSKKDSLQTLLGSLETGKTTSVFPKVSVGGASTPAPVDAGPAELPVVQSFAVNRPAVTGVALPPLASVPVRATLGGL